jgi:uncharacterized protein YjbI with pentapeptide repeats
MKTSIKLALLLLGLVAYQAQAQKSVSPQEIIQLLDAGKDISFKDMKITGDLDFTKVADREKERQKGDWNWGDSQDNYRCHVRNKVSFVNCVFTGEVIGYLNIEKSKRDHELYNVDFHDEVVFQNCKFEEDVNFKYSEFDKGALFAKSIFDEEAFFKYTEFKGKTDFSNSNFSGEATFKYTKFPKGVDFANSQFNEDAVFKYTKFPKGVSFVNTTFRREANFKYAKFSDPANFKNTDFGKDPDFKYTTMNGSNFVNYLIKNR